MGGDLRTKFSTECGYQQVKQRINMANPANNNEAKFNAKAF
ncbi:hypothetical protein [Campylobacter concisus]|nr:hypothetical protein [Campylobacter concisus]